MTDTPEQQIQQFIDTHGTQLEQIAAEADRFYDTARANDGPAARKLLENIARANFGGFISHCMADSGQEARECLTALEAIQTNNPVSRSTRSVLTHQELANLLLTANLFRYLRDLDEATLTGIGLPQGCTQTYGEIAEQTMQLHNAMRELVFENAPVHTYIRGRIETTMAGVQQAFAALAGVTRIGDGRSFRITVAPLPGEEVQALAERTTMLMEILRNAYADAVPPKMFRQEIPGCVTIENGELLPREFQNALDEFAKRGKPVVAVGAAA